MALRLLAPAKVNLYLHVVGRRDDGYHLLDSLVAFAGIGDYLTAEPADRVSLTVAGPEAAALEGLGDDNLVLRAARLLAEQTGGRAGARLHLEKHLPAAAGIGGGSSDAAAALRLLNQLWRCRLDQDALMALALKLGADVPACVAARPVWVGGVGELLEPAAHLPPAGIVLANPRIAMPTAAVFGQRRGEFSGAARFATMPRDATGLAELLTPRRNDLTASARQLAPIVGPVLDTLADLPGSRLARMSGSGATCFALFADCEAAFKARELLAEQEPAWWTAGGALMTAAPAIEAMTEGA